MTLSDTIGPVLKAKRRAMKLSQGAVILLMKREDGMRNWLSRIENGHISPTLDTIADIAAAMGVSSWELVKQAEEMTETQP